MCNKAATLFLLVTLACPSSAQVAEGNLNSSLEALSGGFQRLVKRVDPAVVEIVSRGFTLNADAADPVVRSNRNSGSGVVVDPDGYIVTNAHVVGSARRIYVLVPQPVESGQRTHSLLKPTGKLLAAEVVGMDRETDIAVLKVAERNLPHLAWGDSELLQPGRLVFAFGSPFGLKQTVTMGIVSSVNRQVRDDDAMAYIQTDAAINPGNSGGPLVDTEGALVGINTFLVSMSGESNGVGFAVPSAVAKNAYEQIRQHGRVRRGQIGVVAQTITPTLAAALALPREWGVLVEDVVPGGVAEAAGLKVRDVVVSLDGHQLENARQFGLGIYQNAGKVVQLEVLRNGQPLTLPVAVLERPKDPDRILSLVTGQQNRVARLGILAVELDARVTPLLPALRKQSGVVVAGILADLAMGNNSLHPGDVIHEVNGHAVHNVAEVRERVASLEHGHPVALQIERQGQLQFLLVEVD